MFLHFKLWASAPFTTTKFKESMRERFQRRIKWFNFSHLVTNLQFSSHWWEMYIRSTASNKSKCLFTEDSKIKKGYNHNIVYQDLQTDLLSRLTLKVILFYKLSETSLGNILRRYLCNTWNCLLVKWAFRIRTCLCAYF